MEVFTSFVHPLHGAQIRGVLVVMPDGQTPWVQNVAVHPRYQQPALASGSVELRLYTNELTIENIGLCTRLGYTEVERRLDEGFRRVFMRQRVET